MSELDPIAIRLISENSSRELTPGRMRQFGSMSDDQITAMLINENGGQLTSELMRQFDVTPRLCAKLLFALCSGSHNNNSSSSSTQQQPSSRSFEEVDLLANVCREFLPSASPLTEIIRAIDSESFIHLNDRVITSKSLGKLFFSRFWHFCVNLCNTDKQGISILGLLFFNQLWTHNLEFQLVFVINCIKSTYVPKLLSTGSHNTSTSGQEAGGVSQLVPQIDSLKCQPDLETSPDLANWKFVKVYQVLMDMASLSHSPPDVSSPAPTTTTTLYPHVIEALKWPLTNCPDLVALGLLGCSGGPTGPKKDIIGLTIPCFLGNHANAAVILHLMWSLGEGTTTSSAGIISSNHQNQWAKQVLLQSMCDYYIKSSLDEQQQRLSRILDVAQDLKALSLLLNSSCYPFVIDLACLASRREYLKLDKWLMDKIQSNGEPFVSAAVKFLNKRCPSLVAGNKSMDNNSSSSSSAALSISLPSETLATMLSCLHLYASGPTTGHSKEMVEKILTMVANSSVLLQNVPRPGILSAVSANLRIAPSQSVASAASAAASSQQQQSGSLLPAYLSQSASGAQSLSDGLMSLSLPSDSGRGAASVLPNAGQRMPFSSSGAQHPPAVTSSGQPLLGGVGMAGVAQPDRLRHALGDLAAIFPDMQQNVSPEIEKEADTYFQRIYNQSTTGSMSIDDVLDMLRRFQDSPNSREKEIFACMIRNLFKEYCYFPQYPDKELLITAQLFGGIIQMGLVKYMALVMALRYVLEALRKPHGSKMYFFGIAALDRFKAKLKDYPLYCQHLTSIPHFEDFPGHLIEYIKCGAQSQEPPTPRTGQILSSAGISSTAVSGIGNRPDNSMVLQSQQLSAAATSISNNPYSAVNLSSTATANHQIVTRSSNISIPTSAASGGGSSSSKPSIASADITTLLAAGEAAHSCPPENIQDKVAFIINNLSQMNFAAKADEFKEVICADDHFYPWIAQYFVLKRASIEINFHTLYANFLDVLKINEVTRLVIRETFRNIKVLLSGNKEAENFSDRSLLKNLGHWLGMLTIAKCKPILSVDLDVKKLLIEAYHKGPHELLYVVPFIAKILESTAKSKVFKPPNPWTMGIIYALAELHQEPSLKLNLKFEVEVLCKALNLDLNKLLEEGNIPRVLDRDDLRHRVLTYPQLGSGGAKVQAAPQIPIVGTRGDGLETAFQPSLQNAQHSDESLIPKQRAAVDSRQNSSPQQAPNPVIPSPGVHCFNYHDISINASSLAQHVIIPANVSMLQMQPNLKPLVAKAVERAIQEWVALVIERSMKISIITAEKIIKKDFALESDETIICRAAHYLIRSLTAGMAMITTKEPLFMSIMQVFGQAMSRACPSASKEMIEAAAHAVATENIDLACCFIQKSAVEKATIELDARLTPEYEMRRRARAEGRRYCDPKTLTYQAERMPEPIRLQVGTVPSHQMHIYEEIGRNIPGFINPVIDPPTVQLVAQPVARIPQQHQQQQQQASLHQQQQPPQQQQQQQNFPTAQEQQQVQPPDSGLLNLYDKLVAELENLWDQFMVTRQPTVLSNTMHTIMETVNLARSNPRDIVGALALIQTVLNAILELMHNIENGIVDLTLTTRARDLYLVILKALADPRAYGQQWTTKQITRIVLDRLLSQVSQPLPDDQFDILMRSGLINLPLLDANLAQNIEVNNNPVSLAFSLHFLKIYAPQGLQETDVAMIVTALVKVGKSAQSAQIIHEISIVLDQLRTHQPHHPDNPLFIPPQARSQAAQPVDFSNHSDSDSDFLDKTERLLREWIQMFYSPNHDINKFFQVYVQQMNLHGILKTDDSITRFFQHSTELCVDFCFRLLTQHPSPQNVIETRTKCFHTLDAFAHLILMLVKHSGSSTAESSAKLNLLNKVLNIVAKVALQDQETRGENFQHLPYYRIFIILFMELTLGPNNLGLSIHSLNAAADPLYESIQFQVLSAFCATLRILKPTKCPSFAYAWLDFISHRTFIDKCLNGVSPGASTKGWQLYAQLLIELIKFLAPFLRCVELSSPVDLLYKGTLKVLLVLLHDFPEFLCEFCYEFCDSIPCNAIQMRNLILSAFPRNMRLPDPFTPNLKIEQLPEIIQTPKGMASTLNVLANVPFKKDLDSYLRTRSPVTFLSELRGHLQQTNQSQVDGGRYNIPLMNALVLYVGQAAIQTITPRHINMTTIAHSSHMDIFQNLAVDLDSEGRYLFLNAIANQLRYPNSYTHYFSCALLYLFAESNTEAIQEQITRVLLERLLVNRPHPWGLLVTFMDLLKNPTFKFWTHDFVRCAPEIEKLFESVAKSCMQSSGGNRNPGSGQEVGSSMNQQ